MTPSGVAGAELPSAGEASSLENRFLVSAVAFLRVKQLQSGARPRLETERHALTHIAVLEVLANTISWSLNSG